MSAILYSKGGGSVEEGVVLQDFSQPDVNPPNAAKALESVVERCLYLRLGVPIARAEITKMHIREGCFGGLTNEEIVRVYKMIPGPRPRFKSLIPFWEKARAEEILQQTGMGSDIQPSVEETIQLFGKFIAIANHSK